MRGLDSVSEEGSKAWGNGLEVRGIRRGPGDAGEEQGDFVLPSLIAPVFVSPAKMGARGGGPDRFEGRGAWGVPDSPCVGVPDDVKNVTSKQS